MKKEDIELLEEYDWIIVCEWPLEIEKHIKESIDDLCVGTATGDAVELVLQALRHIKYAY